MKEVFGFDCYSPKEIAGHVENIGMTKADLPLLSQVAPGIAVEVTLILLIDYSPWGNAVFGTAPIPLAA